MVHQGFVKGKGRVFLFAALFAVLMTSVVILESGYTGASNVLHTNIFGQQFVGTQGQNYVSDTYNARAIDSNTPYTLSNGRKTYLLGTQSSIDFNNVISPCNSQYNTGGIYTEGIYNCQPSFSGGSVGIRSRSKSAAKGTTSEESLNWAGWVGSSTTAVASSVQGSWTVQAANPSSTATYSSQWIGIGGFSDSTLVQTGTESDYYNGAAHYTAWYELLPAAETPISGFTVSPGDVISASVVAGTAPNTWVITLTDTSTKPQEAFTITVTYKSSKLSTEWIDERPEICSYTCALTSLSKFGTAPYGYDNTRVSGTNYANMGSGSVTISALPGLTSVTMVNQSRRGTITLLAQPSALTSDGTSFSVVEPSTSTTTSSTSTTATTTIRR